MSEEKREFKDEEVKAIADLVENLALEDDFGNLQLQLPQGMTMERAVFILAWQQKQATAAVFATLDEAFGSDWTTSVEESTRRVLKLSGHLSHHGMRTNPGELALLFQPPNLSRRVK